MQNDLTRPGMVSPSSSWVSDFLHDRSHRVDLPNRSLRPVLCIVPPYDPSVQPATTGRLSSSSCTKESLLSTTNLGTTPTNNADGYTVNSVPLDSRLVGTPSTKSSADLASSTVLLPGLSDSGSSNRYLLGPAQMSSSSIGKAAVQYQQGFDKQWVVNFTTTKRGTALWNKVASDHFHRQLAIWWGGSPCRHH